MVRWWAVLVLAALLAAPLLSRAQDDPVGELLALVNGARAEANLPPLALHPALNAAAQRHSDDMAAQDRAAHEGSDGSTAGERITAAGYAWQFVGQSIVQLPAIDSGAAFAAWMDSADHRANILSPEYVDLGVGVAAAANGRAYITLNFAAPRPAAAGTPPPGAAAASPAAPVELYNAQGIALIPAPGLPPALWFQATPVGFDPAAPGAAAAPPGVNLALLVVGIVLGGGMAGGALLLAFFLWRRGARRGR